MSSLDRQVADLLTDRIVDTEPSTTLREAAGLLDTETVGALLVTGHQGVVGIVTERDLVRAVADGQDLDDTRVVEYLSDDLLTVEVDDSLLDVLRAMSGNEVRHVVVVDAGATRGVLSMRRLVDELTSAVDPTVAQPTH